MSGTHDGEALKRIHSLLASEGITDYRFCIENDCYVCDRHGNFYSVCRRQRSKAGRMTEDYRVVPLAGSKDRGGYTTYRITVNGVKKHLKGHRLMMNAWVGENPSLVVNHKDGNKANNSLDNLEWCTTAENNAHAIRMGLFNPRAQKKKYAVPMVDWVIIYFLHKSKGLSYSEIGRMNHCAHDTIKGIINRVDAIMPEGVF